MFRFVLRRINVQYASKFKIKTYRLLVTLKSANISYRIITYKIQQSAKKLSSGLAAIKELNRECGTKSA